MRKHHGVVRGPRERWVRDAGAAGVDLLVTATVMTGTLLGHSRRPAAVAGLWTVPTLRQGYLVARSHQSR